MPKINTNTIERAKKVFAMLMVLQTEIDELAEDGAMFRFKLKQTAKQFSLELEKQIEEFYGAMNEEANLYYNQEIKAFESFIKAYINNQVEVLQENQ